MKTPVRLLAVAAVLAVCLIVPLPCVGLSADQQKTGYSIAGHVDDPNRLKPATAGLFLGLVSSDGGTSSVQVPLASDGSFAAMGLQAGTYLLAVVRDSAAPSRPGSIMGLAVVRVADHDLQGVVVEVHRETSITGRFRMESDNAGAIWPPHISVGAYFALDNFPLVPGTTADGAPGGRFVLRNAFGPTVLRCGYTLAPGSPWWPTRVLLDGIDITNVPTDFSRHSNSNLEVVFTQRPSRFSGTVVEPTGRPASSAWVVTFSADPSLWQGWSSMSKAEQADAKGSFRFTALPGRYLVAAVPAATWPSRPRLTRDQIAALAQGAVEVALGEREVKEIRLALGPGLRSP